MADILVVDDEVGIRELLSEIDTTQPNMSQHLATLYQAGVLGKRRDGTQVFYRLQSERVATLCRAVCEQASREMSAPAEIPPQERLLGRPMH